jgi:ADP-ribose pyrophosphatase YjhB (NUDIX family)
MFIPEDLYKEIISSTVNLCVDVVLQKEKKYLLIKRTQHPMKDVFWPIGGRIHKGETAEQAARRKIKEEIGVDYVDPLSAIGYYEDRYDNNSFQVGKEYHTLSIVFLGLIDDIEIDLDHTADDYGYFENFPQKFLIKKFIL